MNAIILIPARYASSRYPGKPLVPLRGARGQSKPLIQRSFEAACRVGGVSKVIVTTDDDRIAEECRRFNAPVIMTSSACRNGTERCAEAMRETADVDIVINFQGDALLTPPAFVEALLPMFDAGSEVQVATPAIRLRTSEVRELQAAEARGLVGGTTVVARSDRSALYFSKRLIPYVAPASVGQELTPMRQHIGVYAYRPDALRRYAASAETELERFEALEQLRFLDIGVPVRVVDVEPPPFTLRELNNPEDVAAIEEVLEQQGID